MVIFFIYVGFILTVLGIAVAVHIVRACNPIKVWQAVIIAACFFVYNVFLLAGGIMLYKYLLDFMSR